MPKEELYRLESVNTKRIKRMPGIQIDASQKGIEKIRKFAKERGHCIPVVLSEADGCMTLLSGAAVFEANLKERVSKIPAVIVKTSGDADNLLFALQSASLKESPDMMAISAAIVRLIDCHGIPRKHIAQSMGKSASWLARTESLSRKLNDSVKVMVAQGETSVRTAQEIARLPPEVQTTFAISAGNELLTNENVIYLVNRYLNEDTCEEERAKIVNTPGLALPEDKKNHNFKGRDYSDSARLSRAIGRCLDTGIALMRILDNIDFNEVSIRQVDIVELLGCLNELTERLQTFVVRDNK